MLPVKQGRGSAFQRSRGFEVGLPKKRRGNGLTPPQIETLRLAADGLSYAQIAARLGISLRAVEDRIDRAKKQLDAASLTHACTIAMRSKLFR